MRAIVYDQYDSPDVHQFKDVDKPVPGTIDVLIKVYASTFTKADVNIRGFVFVPPGLQWVARLMLY
jgi:NADPH:quinone reductase-like Zn-dependent oxidoreductase